MAVEIRDFLPHRDIPACELLVSRTLGPHDAVMAVENFSEPLGLPEWSAEVAEHILVAEVGGRIIGICGWWHEHRLPKWAACLYWFAVDPVYQRRGIGSQLLQATEASAVKWFPSMFVESTPDAADFYLKQGYTRTDYRLMQPFPGTILLVKQL